MALLRWTTCFPAFEALTATLNMNWASGQSKARARSLYCHTRKQSWGNSTLPARFQQHFAWLEALSLQMIIKRQQYLVPCIQHPYWKPAFPDSARDSKTETVKGSHSTVVPVFLCNSKTVTVAKWEGLGELWKVLDISWQTQRCPSAPQGTAPLAKSQPRVLQVPKPEPNSLQRDAPAEGCPLQPQRYSSVLAPAPS